MSDDGESDRHLSARIGRKEVRRLHARARKRGSMWFALGLYGVVGWSIVLPTLAGIALGVWIDRTWPSRYSWTLMLLALGLMVGCWNAWRWVASEQREIEIEQRKIDEAQQTMREDVEAEGKREKA